MKPQKSSRTLRGAILDVDGTLIDSNDAHARAWREALAEFGHVVPLTLVREKIGKGGDQLLPELTGLAEDSPEGKAIGKRRAEIFRSRYLPSLRPFPGARALLERMRAERLELVVASSASREDLEALLRAAGVEDLIQEKASSEDAERSKPDPDIVCAALERGGLSPSAAVMLGDTPYDVMAARRAGVEIVALRCGGWDDAALEGATAIYDDPADLLVHFDDSPFAERAAAGARDDAASHP
jgi:HAD superfamily hydrolase (TIGR01509 family)